MFNLIWNLFDDRINYCWYVPVINFKDQNMGIKFDCKELFFIDGNSFFVKSEEFTFLETDLTIGFRILRKNRGSSTKDKVHAFNGQY